MRFDGKASEGEPELKCNHGQQNRTENPIIGRLVSQPCTTAGCTLMYAVASKQKSTPSDSRLTLKTEQTSIKTRTYQENQ